MSRTATFRCKLERYNKGELYELSPPLKYALPDGDYRITRYVVVALDRTDGTAVVFPTDPGGSILDNRSLCRSADTVPLSSVLSRIGCTL